MIAKPSGAIPAMEEAAASLIVRVQPFEKALPIFNDFKLALRRIGELLPYVAMYNRLHAEGRTPATAEYLKCENEEDAYGWAISERIDEAAKAAGVPGLPDVLEREAIEKLNSLRYPKDAESDDRR